MILEMSLWSAIAPLGLLLLSSIWSYPAWGEELVKWAILQWGGDRAQGRSLRVGEGAILGLIFGLSESVLYSLNAWQGGQWGAMGIRLLLTVPMHMVTTVVIVWSMGGGETLKMKRVASVMGLLIAIVIHAGFNYLVR